MPAPRIADDAKEAGAIVLEAFEPLPSTAKASCAACTAAQDDLENPDAACEKHAKYITCFVREPRPGVFSAVQTADGAKLPGEEVRLPTWEYNLPAMRRTLETAEERTARLKAAAEIVNQDRKQRLREIGALGSAGRKRKADAAKVAKLQSGSGA